MDRGPIPLNMHAALEPLIAIVIIAAPWIFGFSDTDSATTICVVVGVVMLLAGAMTDWRMSLVRLTRWDPIEAEPVYTRERGQGRPPRAAR